MPERDDIKASAESLVEDIKNGFIPTDDFARDFAGECERIMNERASLLIASAFNGGRFASFIKAGMYDKGRRSTRRRRWRGGCSFSCSGWSCAQR